MSATTAAARPAASTLPLLTLARGGWRDSVRDTFNDWRSNCRRRVHYLSAFWAGWTHPINKAGNSSLLGGTLGWRAIRWGGFAWLTAASISIPIPAPAALAFTDWALIAGDLIEILVLFEEIRNVEKCIALQAYIDESRLHSRQHACDASFMNAAGQRIFVGALEVDFHQLVVFDQRHFGLMPIG
jgi:hypothetical protein